VFTPIPQKITLACMHECAGAHMRVRTEAVFHLSVSSGAREESSGVTKASRRYLTHKGISSHAAYGNSHVQTFCHSVHTGILLKYETCVMRHFIL
jgi:hypothetical protein